MKKVRYSVSKYQKGGPLTMSGTGYITDTDLVIACTNKYGKLYVRIFEDALKYCFPIIDKNNEFKGNVTEYHDITVDVGCNECRRYIALLHCDEVHIILLLVAEVLTTELRSSVFHIVRVEADEKVVVSHQTAVHLGQIVLRVSHSRRLEGD